MKIGLTYICRIKSSICFNWQEKIIMLSLKNISLCEIAIQNLPFLFHAKSNGINIPILYETIIHFNDDTINVFVKNFRILLCSMYGKTINQNSEITCQEELFCIICDQYKIKTDIQTCTIDNTFDKNLNEFWKILILSFVNNSSTTIKCEIIKNISFVMNHFYPDSNFRNNMLTLINDKDEEVRIQCSKIFSSLIFEKDSTGKIQIVESYFSQLMNILCSTVNASLTLGNTNLQFTCLETIFNIGW